MDVFNKFYSSVSNTVSQLSGVLPGNPVTREFEATQFIASAGPGLLWKIYKGYKKSTKQEASIFVFEKKQLEKFTKADRDIMLDTLKRGIVQLTKLRHPQILTVQHSLEESRESLAFATEPVFASLANILGNMENMPQPSNHLNNYKLYELEIKYGLMQVAEGLAFLHNDVKLLHHNISPESIIVNQQGAWKIFGFDFCIANQSTTGSAPFWPFNEYCPAMNALTQPSLDYLAPEYILSASHSPASDIYSLGMLIYATQSPNHRTLGNIGSDYGKFKKFANELRNLPPSRLSCVAEGLREYVKLMLNATPELRPDPHQFLKIPYFEDVGVKTLNYLDSLFQWDNLQKSQFYKGLPQIIQKMPHRICIYRILPCLTKEFVNSPMVPFVLPNVLLIAENSSKEEFVKYILPVLKPVMMIQDPIQVLLIFMQKMELLLKLTPGDEVKTDILPMLYRALESDAQQIQELCLSVLPTFASLIDYPAMKNALLPRIKKLCMNTNYISVRVNCLLCLGKLLEHLDKWLVLDEIIPHKKLGITKEVMATKVLPFLIPLCVENGLTLNQFNSLITLVKQMVGKVETEHRAKLEQLNSIKDESKLAQQQEVAQRINRQPPPTAIPAPQKTTRPPLDLTSSLLQSNLSALTTQKPQYNINTAQYNQNTSLYNQNTTTTPLYNQNTTTTPVYNQNTTTTPVYNQNTTTPLYNHNVTTPQYNSNTTPQSQPNYGFNQNSPFGQLALPSSTSWTSPTSGNFNNKWANNQNNQTTMKQDWSAFESLLPTATNNNENGNTKK
ncbi:hypothetical protein MSG28_009499, partial [Choristoneura fumiferana]